MLVKWKKYQVTWDIYTKSAQTVYIQFEIIWGRKRRLKLQNKTTPNTKDYFIAFEIPILLLFNSWVLHSQEQSLWFWLAIRATNLLNVSCSSFMHWSVQLTHKNITAHWLNKQARKLARINNCPSYIKKSTSSRIATKHSTFVLICTVQNQNYTPAKDWETKTS